MEHPTVTRLYKYTVFNARAMASLVTEKLWFANPSTFNDPFDCVIPNHAAVHLERLQGRAANQRATAARPHKGESAEIARLIRSLHDRLLNGASAKDIALAQKFVDGHDALQSSINTFGVLSLSATPKSILMWSHYGAQHSGICLEFERTATSKLGTDALPVVYSRLRDLDPDPIQAVPPNRFFMKYSGWRYEREWRVLESTAGLHDFPGRLLSVICGAQMPGPERETVARIVAGLNASRTKKVIVRTAAMKPTTYELVIRPYG